MDATFNLTINIPGNYPGDASNEYRFPEYNQDRIILACDLRGFTLSMEDNQNKTILFISEFFDDMSGVIQANKSGAYVNKYLGDGLIAHFPTSSNSVESTRSVVERAFNSLLMFKNYSRSRALSKAGLSIVLSRERIYVGSVGKSNYRDYTLVGKHVNRVFRALDSAKGNLILCFDNLKDDAATNYCLIDLGSNTYDGVYSPIRLFSIMRKKEPDEVDGKLRLCKEQCPHYNICRNAWKLGNSSGIFINCQECGIGNCWHWSKCARKQNYGVGNEGHKDFQCCHICSHFTQCFHNYYLGKGHAAGSQGLMVWCGNKDLPHRLGTDLSS